MPKPRFRDRFYTPSVARALNSPLGIVLAGGGIAVGIVAGLPLVVSLGLGAAAYAARVAVAIPKAREEAKVNPFALSDPWRTYVWEAKRAQRRYEEAVHHVKDGPLRTRLGEIGERVETGVEECWRVAQGGELLVEARSQIDVTAITTELAGLPQGDALATNPALVETARALQSQLETAKRMDTLIASTGDRLRLLDARLGELVTRVLELTVRPEGDEALTALGQDVDSIVHEMEALRQALDETDAASIAASTGLGAGDAAPASLPPPAPQHVAPQYVAPQQVAPSAPGPHPAPAPSAPSAQTWPPSPPAPTPPGPSYPPAPPAAPTPPAPPPGPPGPPPV